MIWSLIGSIGDKVLDFVDDVVEDKDEANRLKFEIQRQLIENKSNELESAAKIDLAEARRNISHGLTSTALALVALGRKSVRKWIKL